MNSGNSANSGVSYYPPITTANPTPTYTPNTTWNWTYPYMFYAPSVDDVLNALDAGLITKAQAAAKVKVILGVVEEKKK